MKNKCSLHLFIPFLFVIPQLLAAQSTKATSGNMEISFSPAGIQSIVCTDDSHRANVLDGSFGHPVVKYRIGPGDWLDLYQGETKFNPKQLKQEGTGSRPEVPKTVQYVDYIHGMPLKMQQTFVLSRNCLDYYIEIESIMRFPEIFGNL